VGTRRTSLRQWSMIRIPEYVVSFESLRGMALYVLPSSAMVAPGNIVIDNCKARTAFGFAVLLALAIIYSIDLL